MVVTRSGSVDSIHVALDGGARVTVRRDRRHIYHGLNHGAHDVTITRWFFTDGLLTSRTSTLRIQLERGESRTIVFHNDFPLVGQASPPDAGPVPGRWGVAPPALRLG